MKIKSSTVWNILRYAALFVVVVLTYALTLSTPLFFDDFPVFNDFSNVVARYGNPLDSFNSRWLSYGSFAWTIQLFGEDIFWLRLGNVLLHAANVLLLFYFLKRLFQVVLLNNLSSTAEQSRLTGFAFFGALLFALHPVAVYSVAYLTQRSTLMATGFVLLMLIAYLEGLLRNKWYWMVVAAVCYFAAVYSKEHSVAAPGLAIALTFLLRPPSWALLRQITPFFVLAMLVTVSIVLNMKGVIGELYEPRAGGMLDQAQILTPEVAPETSMSETGEAVSTAPNMLLLSIISQSFLFFKYILLWLFPNPAWMSVDMREPLALSLFGWPQSLGVLGFLTYAIGAVWLLCRRGARGLLGLAMLFPAVLFLTEFSTVRVQEAFVLYRSYLWMPGIFLALPVLFGRLPAKLAFLGLALLAVAFVPLTVNRIQSFDSPLTLWEDAEILVRDKQNVLGTERIYFNYGNELNNLGQHQEAISAFNKAIHATTDIDSAYAIKMDFAYANRAIAYRLLGKYQKALSDYNRAIEISPNDVDYYYWRAKLYRELGNYSGAINDIRESCRRGGKCR